MKPILVTTVYVKNRKRNKQREHEGQTHIYIGEHRRFGRLIMVSSSSVARTEIHTVVALKPEHCGFVIVNLGTLIRVIRVFVVLFYM